MSLSPQRVDFEKMWVGIQDGVFKIITLTGTTRGMPLVEDIYKLCTAQPQPHSEQLYFRLKAYLNEQVIAVRESLLGVQGGDILTGYLKHWGNYSVGTMYLDSVFRYLNMNWIKKRLDDNRNKLNSVYPSATSLSATVGTSDVHEVVVLALITWRDQLFMKIKERLCKAAEDLVTRDRDSEQIQSHLVGGLVQSLIKLGSINKNKPLELYKEEYEVPYLINTREYYARESAAFIAANGISNYMKKSETRIEEEAVRSKKFLDTNSHDKLRKECDAVLIERHKDLLQVECEHYLRDDKQDDLSRMYRLLSRIDDGIKPMLDVLQQHVTNVGFDAVKALPDKDANDSATYVETLLSIYRQFSEVVKRSFDNHPSFVASLDKACRKVVNENPVNKGGTKSPELLAKFCDLLLKKGTKNLEEAELEEKLNQIIIIFKYVDDKDVFQKFYSKMLARRLIHGTSYSDDAESIMIGGLKQACGFEYTSKLQRMFTDMTLSIDINDKFKESLTKDGANPLGKLDFSILVLTAGSWPVQAQPSSFNVPQELEKCIDLFQGWYNSQHQGRRLNWLHHLSKGEVRACYLKKPYEFQVTNYQMGVLLLFNSTGESSSGRGSTVLTMDDIMRLSNLKDTELIRTLESLVDSKLLRKQPDDLNYHSSHEFSLNTGFASKRLKNKIAGSLQKETRTQNDETYKGIDDDRKLFLQAAIVRIMKARKVHTHLNLIQEVIEQAKARFQPNIPMIKKCIEHLIEKEYLQRVDGETDRYSYVA